MTPHSLSQLPDFPLPKPLFVPLWMLLFVLSPSPPSSRQRWRRRRRRRRRLAACSCCWLPKDFASIRASHSVPRLMRQSSARTQYQQQQQQQQSLATCCQHTSLAVDRKHSLSLSRSLAWTVSHYRLVLTTDLAQHVVSTASTARWVRGARRILFDFDFNFELELESIVRSYLPQSILARRAKRESIHDYVRDRAWRCLFTQLIGGVRGRSVAAIVICEERFIEHIFLLLLLCLRSLNL